MFYGQQAIKSQKTVQEMLRDSSHVFFLTGSRYFGNQREDSDFDYFVQDSSSVRMDLVAMGFKKIEADEAYAGSPNMVAIYQCGDIHVQCVANARHKSWVQQSMAPLVRSLKMDKQQVREFWRVAFKLYRDGMSEQKWDSARNKKAV